jgi:hypothetical protein
LAAAIVVRVLVLEGLLLLLLLLLLLRLPVMVLVLEEGLLLLLLLLLLVRASVRWRWRRLLLLWKPWQGRREKRRSVGRRLILSSLVGRRQDLEIVLPITSSELFPNDLIQGKDSFSIFYRNS